MIVSTSLILCNNIASVALLISSYSHYLLLQQYGIVESQTRPRVL
jgi:hypothetical protein